MNEFRKKYFYKHVVESFALFLASSWVLLNFGSDPLCTHWLSRAETLGPTSLLAMLLST